MSFNKILKMFLKINNQKFIRNMIIILLFLENNKYNKTID